MQPLIFPFLRPPCVEGRLFKEREYYSVLFALQEVFEIIFPSPFALPRISRKARSIGAARTVSTNFHEFVIDLSQSLERIASYRIETHGFLQNSHDTADLFRARH